MSPFLPVGKVVSLEGQAPRKGRLARWMLDLHLYFGLLLSPFVLVFSASVFFLVHNGVPKAVTNPDGSRSVTNLALPEDLDQLSGRERIEALKPVLDRIQVYGEMGWIQHRAREKLLTIPVEVPGRTTTVTIDLLNREAVIEERNAGLVSAMVLLHKSPGPHLVDLRRNWFFMRAWSWLADATVYLVLFLILSGVYLWWLLRSERRIGIALLSLGALSFISLIYAIVH